MAVLFTWWRRSEGTLSIHHIDTRRRERFYWATVLATFALGTAVGDLTGLTMHLGFLAGGPAVPRRDPGAAGRLAPRRQRDAVLLGGLRAHPPLGASFADWIGKDHEIGGGLGFGDLRLTGLLILAIALLVTWAHRSGHDIQRPIPVDADA